MTRKPTTKRSTPKPDAATHLTPTRAETPTESLFQRYRGIGNPGIPSTHRAIRKWLRDLRGQ